jgi:hypothetical protein
VSAKDIDGLHNEGGGGYRERGETRLQWVSLGKY